MKRLFDCLLILAVLLTMPMGDASHADDKPVKLVPVLKIDKELDQRTAIKPSAIPNAGNGLYAAVAIKKDHVIGELGGRLVTDDDYPLGNYYVASIAECAWEETKPYKYLDSKEFGAHVSRINFAPRQINGIDTHFQNAAIRQLCEYPYVVFVALSDIEAGQEIFSSYGPNYGYDRFMYEAPVRDYFCAKLKLDCASEYRFEP